MQKQETNKTTRIIITYLYDFADLRACKRFYFIGNESSPKDKNRINNGYFKSDSGLR